MKSKKSVIVQDAELGMPLFRCTMEFGHAGGVLMEDQEFYYEAAMQQLNVLGVNYFDAAKDIADFKVKYGSELTLNTTNFMWRLSRVIPMMRTCYSLALRMRLVDVHDTVDLKDFLENFVDCKVGEEFEGIGKVVDWTSAMASAGVKELDRKVLTEFLIEDLAGIARPEPKYDVGSKVRVPDPKFAGKVRGVIQAREYDVGKGAWLYSVNSRGYEFVVREDDILGGS